MDFSDGATWIRADLHLHSPAAPSFKLPSGGNIDNEEKRQEIIEEYVQQLIDQNITIGAITDYQQIRKEWFTDIRNLARECDIFLFPGVELSILSVRKFHVLVVFDLNEDVDAVNRYIQSMDKSPQVPILSDQTHQDLDSKDSPFKILQELKNNFSCIIIFAHPEDENGLIKEFKPKQAADYLKLADGIEYLSDRGKQKVLSTTQIPRDFFENFATLENSDPKSILEIGTKQRKGKIRQTFFKLSSISLEALKIALQDPKLRIRIYEKPSYQYDKIKSIDIKGHFLNNIHIELNTEMTALIGGRGVGKSAIIEALRYALDLPIYADAPFRTDFVAGVVGSGGEIKVHIERYFGEQKQNYIISRIIGKLPEVLDGENFEHYDLEPMEIFEEKTAPIILGQKELYALSLDKSFQLKLIDDFIGQSIRREVIDFDKLIVQLKENASKILQIEKKLQQKENYEQQLKTLNSQIKTFERLGVVDKLKRFTDLLEDEKKLLTAFESINRLKNDFEEYTSDVENEFDHLYETLTTAKSEKQEIIMKDTLDILIDLQKKLREQHTSLLKIYQDYLNKFEKNQKNWSEQKQPIELEVIRIKKQLQAQRLLPDKYESLVKEKIRIEPLLKELEKMSDELTRLAQTRKTLKDQLKKKRFNIFKIRQGKLSELNHKLKGRLRIKVQYEKNQQKFRENIQELCRGSNIRSEAIDSILNDNEKTMDGIQLSEFLKKDISEFISEFNLTEQMANRFISWFGEKSRLFELETHFPEDQINIELKVGDEFKPLDKLSAGQKATALLLLLFAQENRILIIDQPEEDLDNRFIYEDVVKLLREMKEKRQIILATHNANIPVLGDSEQIIVLEANNDKCQILETGSIDKFTIREQIKNILEGGEEAFRLRAKKYGSI